MIVLPATSTGLLCPLSIGKLLVLSRFLIFTNCYRGEPGDGKWTVVVKDTKVNEFSGSFTDWRMILWGEAIDGKSQKLYPLPTDHDDDDHDDMDDDDEEDAISAIVGTTSVEVHPSTELPQQPTDHPDRPVNLKHTTTTTTTTGATASATATGSSTTKPTAASDTTPTATSTFLLPSIFPTFGVSPRTQIWIYGAIGAIIIFCAALGAFFCFWRRRSNSSRADYEFEMIEDQDNSGATVPLSGGAPRHKRRGGELYDAFRGESDEEAFSDVGDEGEYKDEPERNRSGGSGNSTPPERPERR